MKRVIFIAGISTLVVLLFIGLGFINMGVILPDRFEGCAESNRDNYSWYQTMNFSLNFEGRDYTAESTIKVVWDKYQRLRIDPRLPRYQPKFYGAMPIIELDGGDFIVISSLSRFNRHAATRIILSDYNFREGFTPSYACKVTRGEVAPKQIQNGMEQSPDAFFLRDNGDGYDVSFFEGEYSLTVSVSQIGNITEKPPAKLAAWLSKLPQDAVTTMPTSFSYPDGLGNALYQYDVWREDQ